MADKLRRGTDKTLKSMEDTLEGMYKDAEKDLHEKWDKYMQRAEKRVEKYENALQEALKSGDAAKIAEARKTLAQKKEAIFFRDKQFSEMVDAVTDRLANVNKIAVDYCNNQMTGIYRYNYNGVLREAQEAAKSGGIRGIAFNMLDEGTIKKLVKDGEIQLPYKDLDKIKDKLWNKKAIASQMMQGIVQGESIPKMAKRLEAVTDMDKKAAVRNARTMTTEAENGGRQASMEEAEEIGLEYEKIWMATHDERTRESHAVMDGVAVPVDEPFILTNHDGTTCELMFPGDPSGDAEQVYNCRCSLVRKLVGYKGKKLNAGGYKPDYFD